MDGAVLDAGHGLRCPMCDVGAADRTGIDALVLRLTSKTVAEAKRWGY